MNNTVIQSNVIINENAPMSIVIDGKLYMFQNRQAVIAELNRLCDHIEFLVDHITDGIQENRERIARGEEPIKETTAPVLHICSDGNKENVSEKIACGLLYCCWCGKPYDLPEKAKLDPILQKYLKDFANASAAQAERELLGEAFMAELSQEKRN
jgi:hypothetical protein